MFVARRRHRRKKKAIASQGLIRVRRAKVKPSRKAKAKAPEKVKAPAKPAKPKGREALQKLFVTCEGLLTPSGVYRFPPILSKSPDHPKSPKLPRKIKLNPNRFGPSPFSGLQSAGMPGNEETDPGPHRLETNLGPSRLSLRAKSGKPRQPKYLRRNRPFL